VQFERLLGLFGAQSDQIADSRDHVLALIELRIFISPSSSPLVWHKHNYQQLAHFVIGHKRNKHFSLSQRPVEL
jgi:hypothetical protein